MQQITAAPGYRPAQAMGWQAMGWQERRRSVAGAVAAVSCGK